MNDFVESPDSGEGLPPFAFSRVAIRTFVLPARLAALEAWCDRYLNLSLTHRFRPVAPFVTLGFNAYPSMRSLAPGTEDVGFISQHEYYFMMPVVCFSRHDSGFLIGSELSFAFPFIGVDCDMSAFTGREVLGFAKTVGDIVIEPPADDGSFAASVTMPAFARPGAQVGLTPEPIVNVRTGRSLLPTAAAPDTGHSFPWNLLGHTAVLEQLENLALHLFHAVDPGAFSVVNLKQIRDAETPVRAAYQALVRCGWTIDRPSEMLAWLPGEVTIELFDNATYRIRDTLGLGDGPLEVVAASGYTADMRFDHIRNLWVAR